MSAHLFSKSCLKPNLREKGKGRTEGGRKGERGGGGGGGRVEGGRGRRGRRGKCKGEQQ